MNRRTVAGIVVGLSVAGAIGAWWLPRLPRGRAPEAAYARLVRAVGSTRVVEARLTGGFAHAVMTPSRGPGGQPAQPALPPDIRLAAAEVELEYERRPTATGLARSGVARLVLGETDQAVEMLERAVGDGAGTTALSDLSAAFLTRGTARDSARDLARALDAALRATELDPHLAEAWANAAQAMGRLGLVSPAREAWSRAAHTEAEPGWKAEAAQASDASARVVGREERVAAFAARLTGSHYDAALVEGEPDIAAEALERSLLTDWARAILDDRPVLAAGRADRASRIAADIARITGDRQPPASVRAMLEACRTQSARCRRVAGAYASYAAGRGLWDQERTAEAYTAFDAARAPLEENGCPEAGWIGIVDATRDFYGGRMPAALSKVQRVESDARRRGFTALAARAAWMRGLILAEQGEFGASLQHLRNAATAFERCRDRENAAAVHNLLASYYVVLGDVEPAWRHQAASLRALPVARRYKHNPFLSNAALVASADGLRRAALVFQHQAVAEMRELHAAASLAIAQGDEAAALARLHRRPEALALIDAARTTLAAASDAELAALVGATLAIQEAAIVETSDPVRAADALDRAIAYYRRHGSLFMLPGLLLDRGRALARGGQRDAAENAWREGLALSSAQHGTAGSDASRVELQARRWDLFSALAEARSLWHGDPVGGFDLVDRGRTAEGASPAAAVAPMPRSVEDVRTRLGPDTLGVELAVLPARTIVWIVDASGVGHHVIERPAHEMAADVRAFRDALEQRAEGRLREAASSLFERLLGPARERLRQARRLIVVPDGPLHDLPFAALRDEQSSRLLVEHCSILLAPSLRFALSGPDRPPAGSPAAPRGGRRIGTDPGSGVALVIGNPDRSPDVADLPHLPGAQREAEAIGRVYTRRLLLTGPDATRLRVLGGLRDAEVVHFAGHAIVNRERPELSRLVLAPSTDDPLGALFARDIAAARLPRTKLVVLAGCDTARGAVAKGEGVLGLVRGFLGAGAPSVVATLWRIDDRSSTVLFEKVHAGWARGLDPAEALREAQLALLDDRNSATGTADWAAAVAVGRRQR
jgi:CHAT domain-containing protein